MKVRSLRSREDLALGSRLQVGPSPEPSALLLMTAACQAHIQPIAEVALPSGKKVKVIAVGQLYEARSRSCRMAETTGSSNGGDPNPKSPKNITI